MARICHMRLSGAPATARLTAPPHLTSLTFPRSEPGLARCRAWVRKLTRFPFPNPLSMNGDHAMGVLAAVVVIGAGYYVSLLLWPYTACGRCGGSGRNAGSSRRRFGVCKRCGGSGRKERFGVRLVRRGR